MTVGQLWERIRRQAGYNEADRVLNMLLNTPDNEFHGDTIETYWHHAIDVAPEGQIIFRR